jgi:hypothetical protein
MSKDITIRGSGGGGGSSSPRVAVEDKDTLQSNAIVSMIDLIGEGEIGGLVNGARSIFINSVPMQNADGTYNFTGVSWEARNGTQDQTNLDGFDGVESPHTVNLPITAATPATVFISNPDVDYVRMIVNVNALISQDATTGDTHGSSVEYKYSVSTNGGAFVDYDVVTKWLESGTAGETGGFQTATRGVANTGSVGATFKIFPTSAGMLNSTPGDVIIQPQYYDGSTWVDMGEQIALDSKFKTYYDSGLGHDVMQSVTSEPVWLERQHCQMIRAKIIKDNIYAAVSIVPGSVRSTDTSSVITVTGKTKSLWQRSDKIKLPKPGVNWSIKLTRITPD